MKKKMMALVLSMLMAVSAFPGAVRAEEAENQTETEAIDETETEAVQIFWDETKVLYMIDDVYVRKDADSSSEALAVAHRGEAIVAVGEFGDWYIVDLNAPVEEAETLETEEIQETEETAEEESEPELGYIVKKYLTTDSEEAEQAVQAQEYAVQEQEAAAAAAAAAEAAAAEAEAAAAEAAAAAAAAAQASGNASSQGSAPDCLNISPESAS